MRTIGTAGHVDHGKSTLVYALTGMNPDRLQEEVDRQMTIDLGFAWFTLEHGQEVGIVDVPGHRDFIDNMLAGVGSIDAVVFVIAADEGIMPQTREHLHILDLLQIERGIVVISKEDLVEPEWLDLVREEVAELISNSSLHNASILSVSAVEKTGIDELKHELSVLLESSPTKLDKLRPRLSIDRVFTLTGFGTVVTGTLIGGSFEEGQEVEVQPRGLKTRIRNIQSHKTQRQRAQPGGRVALNLGGIEKNELARGDTVVLPGQWKSTRLVDAHFRALTDLDATIKHNQEVKMYHGAAQCIARIRLIGQSEITPGTEGWIQLLLSEPILVDRDDLFILRRPSPGRTLGGGKIVDPHPKQRYKQKDRTPIERLEKLLAGDPQDVVLDYLSKREPTQFSVVVQKVNVNEVEGIINTLIAEKRILHLGSEPLGADSYLVTQAEWAEAKSRSTAILMTYHEKFPLRPGMPVQEYRTRMQLDPKWANPFIKSANQETWFRYEDHLIRLPSHVPTLLGDQQAAVDRLLERFKAQPFNTPSKREILSEIEEEVLQFLIWREELISVGADVFFTMATYTSAVEKIREVLMKQETITVAEVRDLFKTSRKYALALMEYLDSVGITARDGDVRRLLD